ncbi:MAG: hypothetical protein PHT55_06420, partial [Spirochaetales bacterium]|nr:hypothetical protein [Spirochaetales bacterium]
QQEESTSQHDEGLSLAEISVALGDVDDIYLKRELLALSKRGLVDSSGRGKKRRWTALRTSTTLHED